MPGLIETFAPPFTENVNGEEVQFPVLSLPDLAAWAREIHTQWKTVGKALIPPDMTPEGRFRCLRVLENGRPTVDDLNALVFTPDGGRRVLELSLAKAGVAKPDQGRILAGLKPKRALELAADVSGLFDPRKPDEKEIAAQTARAAKADDGGGDPNSETPEGAGESSATS